MHRLTLGLCLVFPAVALAQLEELENPGTVSAVQERAYRMQHELNLSVGVLPLDAFYKSYYAQVGYVFHFTDYFAWQVGRGAYGLVARTGLREQLERDFGVLPTAFDEAQWFVGSDLMWKPLYGKVSLMNRSVLHGEVFLLAGASVFYMSNSKIRPAVNLGGGARLFASRWVSFRLDATDAILIPTGASNMLNVLTITVSLAVNFGGTE